MLTKKDIIMKKTVKILLLAVGMQLMGVSYAFDMSSPPDSLAVDTTGKIGIGTANPTTALHIRNSGAVLKVEDINTVSGIRNLLEMKNKGPVGFKLTDTSSTGDWAFRTGGGGSFIATRSGISGPMLSMSASGSVAFGQNPAVPNVSNMVLSASGDLSIKGAFITPLNTYADYVFNDDYKLMPLDELQAFVEKNKHLPNVPSEAEVNKTKMINVSALQITQLEKIEELTLYTLQQHEQIKALKKKSGHLQKQLSDQTMALKAENGSLQERLAALEKLVTNLASASTLKGKGRKFALK